MEKPNFKHMCMMYIQQLTNFPFIEQDFDFITNYEFLCKVVEYLNQVIQNANTQNDAITQLYNSFIELKNYVDNYFDNLNVQEEINNKLDEMAESGQLTDIIAQYLSLSGIIAFNTVAEMKLAENIVNGSKCQTFGFRSVNDGGKALYKIRNITNEDVVDEMTIIALNDNTLIAELIYDNEINIDQLGAYGDGEHNDYAVFNKCVSLAKEKLIPIKLNKTYLISTPIILNENDCITLIGNYTGKYSTYRKMDNIIIDNNSLFVGNKLLDNQLTNVCINAYGVKFGCVSGTKGTLFKALMLYGSTFEDCQFSGLYGFLEGGFNFVSTLRNCQTLNIRNFFISDYIFTTPTDLKNIRNGTTDLSSVTENFYATVADSPNLFDGCYFNGYNPASSYTSLDLPCFHLLYYNDSEICGNDCFIDFWYAIEESFRTASASYAMSWKNCVFQNCIYFFGFKNTNYPSLKTFEFIGNELVNFAGEFTIPTDHSDYNNAFLNPNTIILNCANIKDNYFKSTNNKFYINQGETKACTSGNRFNLSLGCPLTKNTNTQYYASGVIDENRFEELNNLIYEVASLPTTISRSTGPANAWDLYFNGRKFIFKVNDEYIPKTMIMIDSTTIAFI